MNNLNKNIDAMEAAARQARSHYQRGDLIECYASFIEGLTAAHAGANAARQDTIQKMERAGFLPPGEVPEVPLMRVLNP